MSVSHSMRRASTRSHSRLSGVWYDSTIEARSPGYGSGALKAPLPDPQLCFSFLGGHDARIPARRPHQVDVDVVDSGEPIRQHRVRLRLDDWTKWAGRRRQRHIDDDVLGLVVDLHAIDEAEVDDADADLGVVHALQRLANLLLVREGLGVNGLCHGGSMPLLVFLTTVHQRSRSRRRHSP